MASATPKGPPLGAAPDSAVPADVWMPWAAFVLTFGAYAVRRFKMGKSFDDQDTKERALMRLP